jgi:hypothetical protein
MTGKIRLCLFILMGFLCTAASPAQGLTVVEAETPDSAPLAGIDAEALKLAETIGGRISASAAGQPLRVRVAEFTGSGGLGSPFSVLWTQNLINALINLHSGSFTLTSDSAASADFIINGQIIEAGPVVRVVTRLVKRADYSFVAGWNTDFPKSPLMTQLLAGSAPVSEARAGSSRSSVPPDSYETDSREAPVRLDTGGDWVSRTFHSDNDEDWFIITADRNGFLTLETGGDRDTIMKLYAADSSSVVEEDDDGGENMNARIEYYAAAGESYIVNIRDYDKSAGEYRFRAFLRQDEGEGAGIIETKSNNSREQALELDFAAGSLRTLFDSSSDADWYRFTLPEGGGRLTVYTEGGKDTYMALYDAAGKELKADDDSGDDNNASLDIRLPAGPAYLCVTEYDHKRGAYSLFFKLEK